MPVKIRKGKKTGTTSLGAVLDVAVVEQRHCMAEGQNFLFWLTQTISYFNRQRQTIELMTMNRTTARGKKGRATLSQHFRRED